MSVFFVLFTATIYAWLAGVIVELVSRMGERTHEVDGIFDSPVAYMQFIGFPHTKRQKFLRLFWCAKPYLQKSVVQAPTRPALSNHLKGELVHFSHGATFTAMPIFTCLDLQETERFRIAIAASITTKLCGVDESITIDGPHVLLEGLVMHCSRLMLRKSAMGELIYIGGAHYEEVSTAVSLTFSAFTFPDPSDLEEVLGTGSYPDIKSQCDVIHQGTAEVQAHYEEGCCRKEVVGTWELVA
jgi:hypothetical protein